MSNFRAFASSTHLPSRSKPWVIYITNYPLGVLLSKVFAQRSESCEFESNPVSKLGGLVYMIIGDSVYFFSFSSSLSSPE